ncbi:50S ribosomal protein L37ae [Candidatus Woesearchaeota archaeon]|nr:50S ribosomal protein L37ae [Candidatus Woesearchaeota archaeon]
MAKSAGKFGVRYGRTLRKKYQLIENLQRKAQKCPYCEKVKVKRVAKGIFQCKSCNAKFTGKAYHLGE